MAEQQAKKRRFETVEECDEQVEIKKQKIDKAMESDTEQQDEYLFRNLHKLLQDNPFKIAKYEEPEDEDEDIDTYFWGRSDEEDPLSVIIFFNHDHSIIETRHKYLKSLKSNGTISNLILNADALFQLITDFACDDQSFTDQQLIDILNKTKGVCGNKWYKCSGDTFDHAVENIGGSWDDEYGFLESATALEAKSYMSLEGCTNSYGYAISTEMSKFMLDNLYDCRDFHFTDTDNYLIWIYLGRTKTNGHLAGYILWEFTN